MKKTIISLILLLSALGAQTNTASAQTGKTGEWLKKYERQINAVGLSGVGVETILDRWAQEDSLSIDYLKARYAFWYDKSHSVKVEAHNNPKYLGLKPLLSLKDSTGVETTWYYEVDCYDDLLFGRALRTLDKAIAVAPDDLQLRVWKISALILYERESPDLSRNEILKLIDEDHRLNPKWIYSEAPELQFNELIQEFCYNLFVIGTDNARQAFLEISQKMLSYDKNALDFLANTGSYEMSVKNYKKALKIFDKVIKMNPDHASAIQNAYNIARILQDEKLKKKYQPMLSRLR